MTFQSIFSTELDLLEDSLLEDSDEEEEEFKKGVLLVCVLAEEYVCWQKNMCAGRRISCCKGRQEKQFM